MNNVDDLEKTLEKEGYDKEVRHRAMMAEFSGEEMEKPNEKSGEKLEEEAETKAKDPQKEEKLEEKQELESQDKETPPKNNPDLTNAALAVRTRRLEGKIGALQDELKKAKESNKQTPAGQAQALQDHLKKLEKLEADFPEEAKAIRNQGELLQNEIKAIREQINTGGYLTQDQFDTALKSSMFEFKQRWMLDSAHPGWEDMKESKAFKAWLADQNADVNELADSDHAQDAIKVLDLYAEHAARAQKAEEKANQEKERVDHLRSAIPPTKGSEKSGKQTTTSWEATLAAFND